jgi:hypothetical protein
LKVERRIRAYRYAPVGKCIYCGGSPSPAERLSDEHIVALSLGGVSILPEASCRDCAKVTSYIEGYCANKIFDTLRVQSRLPTRRPKNRPTTLPTVFDIDGMFHTHFVPPKASIASFVMYELPPPGILQLRLPSAAYDFVREVVISSTASRLHHFTQGIKLGAQGSFSYGQRNSPFVFGRMLAKIAHAYCMAEDNLANFKPLLPDIILGKNDKIPYLIGCTLGGEPSKKRLRGTLAFHQLRMGTIRSPLKEFRHAYIRLFADLPTPTYTVIIGERAIRS